MNTRSSHTDQTVRSVTWTHLQKRYSIFEFAIGSILSVIWHLFPSLETHALLHLLDSDNIDVFDWLILVLFYLYGQYKVCLCGDTDSLQFPYCRHRTLSTLGTLPQANTQKARCVTLTLTILIIYPKKLQDSCWRFYFHSYWLLLILDKLLPFWCHWSIHTHHLTIITENMIWTIVWNAAMVQK